MRRELYELFLAETRLTVYRQSPVKICENSKMLCYHNDLPELNHNEIVGWENNSIFVFPRSAVANLPIKDVFLFNGTFA